MVDEALAAPADHPGVLGVIFTGGASRRYGSDKALAVLNGLPLLRHVLDRVRPQVGRIVLCGQARAGFDLLAVPDEMPGAGPLGGLCSALGWAQRHDMQLVATFACDTPFLPEDCVARLGAAIGNRDCAVASWAGHLHPTCALWRPSARAGLQAAFASGERRLRAGAESVDACILDFAEGTGAEDDPFFNINSPGDMRMAQDRLWTGKLT